MQGITFRISDKSVNAYSFGRTAKEPVDILRRTWEEKSRQKISMVETRSMRCKDLLQSSMPNDHEKVQNFIPQSNGFVDTILQAYNQHHNLVIRPDDIWIAILSQLNLYVNANAEELRKFFVQHEGKKKLELIYEGTTRRIFDFTIMARDFSALLKKNINDPSFGDFILPNFSTTGPNDTVICSIIMMSILKEYFSYHVTMLCGIPEITLLGTKEDYINLLHRVDQLSQMGMGVEPQAFAAMLKPIIMQFISAFDAVAAAPQAPQINYDFWGHICHKEYFGSGSALLSGWVTAFCVWDEKGCWCGPDLNTLKYQHSSEEHFQLDEMHYPIIDIDRIPPGLCEAEVVLNDNGEELKCMVVAGHIAMEIVESPGSSFMGTVRPAPQWFMFEKEDVVEKREVEEWMKPYLNRATK